MNRVSRLASLLVLLCCTHLQAASSSPAQALVDDLNRHYQNTAAHCDHGNPAYYCSGVIVRAVEHSDAHLFWTHSPAATELRSVTFSYLRADLGITGLTYQTGFIFSDQDTALAEHKAQKLRCIYPFMAGTQNTHRSQDGCGFANTAPQPEQPDDQSNCHTLSVPAVTASAWLNNYRAHGNVGSNQCSLSTRVASEFAASLMAHEGVNDYHATVPNELLVATWNEDAPQNLPIVGFFYDARAPALYAQAQKLQGDYQRQTGRLLPVVRLNLAQADNNVFSLPPSPVDGAAVAAELNRRFNTLDDSCAGNPAYYCNGVLTRIVNYSPDYKAWNPSPDSQALGSVAFSYLRRDVNIAELYSDYPLAEGLIFKDLDTAARDGNYSMTLLCSFVTDADSRRRANNGCGANPAYPSDSGYCSTQNITTVDQWWAHYSSVAGGGPWTARNYHQCSFLGSSASAFAVSLHARERLPAAEAGYHNEVVLRVWPQDIAAQLPLQAIFYHVRGTRGVGLAGAQGIQRDYKNTTGEILPIVRITLEDPSSPFRYQSSDQAVTAP